jgi:hypothetical protein
MEIYRSSRTKVNPKILIYIYGYHKANKRDKYRTLIWNAGLITAQDINTLKEFTNKRKEA